MQRVIGFISDFGLDDTWVGVCHAVIVRACPQARVVDLGHNVPPFDIRKGAATAAAAIHQLPDAILLVVVDPGVGPSRRDLCVVAQSGAVLVGPDNGVLLPAAQRAGGVTAAYAIDPTKIDFRAPLATFHARDVLAPAAAAIACGVQPSALGEQVDPDELVQGPFGASRLEGDELIGEVLESDRFGSLRFTITAEDLAHLSYKGRRLEMALGHVTVIAPVGESFSSVEEGAVVVLVDSSGWMTLAVNRGSALERYGVSIGATVRVRVVD
jgi:S-adenosylmethionine hydrolase